MGNQRWTIDRFLPLYLEAAEQGMTKEQFAEKLGLKPETVYQRAYALRRQGKDIPLLRSAGKIAMLEQADKILEAYRAKKSGITAAPKVRQGKEEAVAVVAPPVPDAESPDIASILGLN
jgi:hypothetical protein